MNTKLILLEALGGHAKKKNSTEELGARNKVFQVKQTRRHYTNGRENIL